MWRNKDMPRLITVVAALLLALLQQGCLAVPVRPDSPVPLAKDVDLPRFMGDWYVIAHIPAFADRDPYNAVETYRLAPDGTIATTYTRREGGFEGDVETATPTGTVVPGTGNALWGMQFFPLVRAEYRIAYLAADYSVTIIGRSDLDYVWLMSRTPAMSDADYQRHLALIGSWGYDLSQVKRVPQRWPGG